MNGFKFYNFEKGPLVSSLALFSY